MKKLLFVTLDKDILSIIKLINPNIENDINNIFLSNFGIEVKITYLDKIILKIIKKYNPITFNLFNFNLFIDKDSYESFLEEIIYEYKNTFDKNINFNPNQELSNKIENKEKLKTENNIDLILPKEVLIESIDNLKLETEIKIQEKKTLSESEIFDLLFKLDFKNSLEVDNFNSKLTIEYKLLLPLEGDIYNVDFHQIEKFVLPKDPSKKVSMIDEVISPGLIKNNFVIRRAVVNVVK